MIGRRSIRKTASSKLMKIDPELALRFCPPSSLSMELTSACNIKCLCCPVGQGRIPKGSMSPSTFKKILELLPKHIRQLDFSHRGDPTVNRAFPEMIRHAHEKGYRTDLYTNGLLLDRYVDQIVECGLTTIRIDLDGASQQSYERYRNGSSFERVRDNIARLVEARASSKSGYPRNIFMICVVSSFNEDEIPEIQTLARTLGVDRLLFKTAITKYGLKYYNDESTQEEIAPRNRALARKPRRRGFVCPFLWRGAILYNGDLIMCTCDFEGEYRIGNVLEENSYKKVFYGPKARAMRKHILSETASLCGTCAVVEENHYIPEISMRFA